jgi:hypothetical protein
MTAIGQHLLLSKDGAIAPNPSRRRHIRDHRITNADVPVVDDVVDEDLEVKLAVDVAVVLLAKMNEDEFQSSKMLSPSSSSRKSGARVQAGPRVGCQRIPCLFLAW